MIPDYKDLNDGIDVAIRSYDSLKEENNKDIYREKMKFLGQCLVAMKERLNERSKFPPT